MLHIERYLKDSMENEKDLTWNRQMLGLIQEMIHELSTIDSREQRLCQIVVDFIKLRLGGKQVCGKVSAKGCLIRRGTTDF